MTQHMSCNFIFTIESGVTFATLVGSLLGMDQHVITEIVRTSQLFSANRTPGKIN